MNKVLDEQISFKPFLLLEESDCCVIRNGFGKSFVYCTADNSFYELDSKSPEKIVSLVSSPDEQRLNICKSDIGHSIETSIEHLILNITERCNLRCHYCSYSGRFPGERVHSSKTMPEHIAYSALEYYLNHSNLLPRKTVSFYGGEPLLEFSKIKAICEKTKTKIDRSNITFSLTTNGTIANSDVIRYLVENEFIIAVSIDGPSVIHNSYRTNNRGEPTFDNVISFISNLINAYSEKYVERIALSVTIANPKDIEPIHDFFRSNYLLRNLTITINIVDWKRSHSGTLAFSLPEDFLESLAVKYVKDVLSDSDDVDRFAAAFFDNAVGRIFNRAEGKRSSNWPCGCCILGTRRLFVSTDGYYYPCERVGVNFPIGRVSEGIRIDYCIELIEAFYKETVDTCSKCWAKRLCSLCLSLGRWKGKIDKDHISSMCEGVKRNLALMLSIYLTGLQYETDLWSKYFQGKKLDVVL